LSQYANGDLVLLKEQNVPKLEHWNSVSNKRKKESYKLLIATFTILNQIGSDFEMSWLKGMREKEPPEPANPIGTVVMGTIQPDVMDTAKEMVRKSLKLAQFKTVDAGKGVSPETLALKAKEANADIIVVTVGLSAARE
jgi:hypothetical protein